ncbi:MAG TPA: tRNA-intron lyase, partial [Nitrososphaera sp.]|nr:tRNA-intron lyase [Nitrososphaera sp.]
MSSAPPSAQPFSEKSGEAEMPPVVEAHLAGGGKIIVDETRFQDELRTKGFGEKEDGYVLKPYEALYLMHTKRLT